MKIVIAPDSFKENLTSLEVANELEAGFKRVWPDATYVKVPMADGGEGTVDSLVAATGGSLVTREVTGPMGEKVQATYGLLGDGKTAVIEMAAASGLPLVPRGERNPLLTTTYGTGELIADAISRGVNEIIVGLGGSATNDGGAGMAQALGVRFLGVDGTPIAGYLAGGRLHEIIAIDMSAVNPGLAGVKVNVASDVTNPLCGENGASAVYGPQKGATPEMVAALDINLAYLASLIQRDVGVDILNVPGAGAGGGIGAGVIAFAKAELKRGVELLVAATKLDDQMKGADLAVTGEGRVDFQTAFGKTPAGVAASARRHGVPVVAIGGGLSDDARGVFEHGIDGLEAATSNPMPLETALKNARHNLQNAAERVARMIVIGQSMVAAHAEAGPAAKKSPANGATSDSREKPQAPKKNAPVKQAGRAKRKSKPTPAARALSERRRARKKPA
jgi:glycerate kinase